MSRYLSFFSNNVGLLLGPILFLLFLSLHIEGMSWEAQAVAASTLWIATWWISEAIPFQVTSLLPLVLIPLSSGMSIRPLTAAYGDKIIFLFLGAFIIALAMERWNLHKRIALKIILFIGSNTQRVILGFMIATAFLSMWISNTATTLMMLPIGLAVMKQVATFFEDEKGNFGKSLLLGVAYSASIGGLATIVGTPTNGIFMGMNERFFQQEITFTDWFILCFPLVVILVLLCWLLLTKFVFKVEKHSLSGKSDVLQNEYQKLGAMSYEEKSVLAVFAFAALAWISRSYVLVKLFPAIDDTSIGIAAAALLFIIPSSNKKQAIMTWEAAVKLPWGVLILFGGGLAIAASFQNSGLAEYIANELSGLKGADSNIIIISITTLINFLTEITSNVATATVMLPILATLAEAINIHPYALMIAATLASSCAFMLPVATAPNAVVFSSGMIRMKDMIRAGFLLNIASIIIIFIFVSIVLPYLWNIDLTSFPF